MINNDFQELVQVADRTQWSEDGPFVTHWCKECKGKADPTICLPC